MNGQSPLDPRTRRLALLAVGSSGTALAAIAFVNPLPLEQIFGLRLGAMVLLAGFALLFASAVLRRAMRQSLEPETGETSRWFAFFVFSKLTFLIAVLLLLGGIVVEWLLTHDCERSLKALIGVVVASFAYSVLGRALIQAADLARRWPRHARGK